MYGISRNRTVAPSGRGDVVAELVGDFAAYAELSSLRDHWLMIPVQPGLSPNQIFTSNLDMWSIFEQSLVSTNGECDKIGVSYTAFRYQTEACDRPFGSCLNNQIFHYEMEDQARAARGLSPLYNIRRYGGGTDNVGQALQTVQLAMQHIVQPFSFRCLFEQDVFRFVGIADHR